MGLLRNISSQKANGSQIHNIEIERIVPDPHQPRKNFANLEELATTISRYGLQNPLHVKKTGEQFIIITGERRWRACKEYTDLKVVPCIIHDRVDAKDIRHLQLIENLQRDDLGLLEQAEAFQDILHEGGKQIDLAAEVGISVTEINKSLKLLRLADIIKNELADYPEVPKSILIEIAGEDEQLQLELWNSYKSGEITNRQQLRNKKKSDTTRPNAVADQEADEIWKTVKKAVKRDPSVAERIINRAKISDLPAEVLWGVVATAVKKDKSLVRQLFNNSEIKKLLGGDN